MLRKKQIFQIKYLLVVLLTLAMPLAMIQPQLKIYWFSWIICFLFLGLGIYTAKRCIQLMQAASVIRCWLLITNYAFFLSIFARDFQIEASALETQSLLGAFLQQILTSLFLSLLALPWPALSFAACMIFGSFYVIGLGFLFAPPLEPLTEE